MLFLNHHPPASLLMCHANHYLTMPQSTYHTMPLSQQTLSPDPCHHHQDFAEGSESGCHQQSNENINSTYLPMCRATNVLKARWKRCSWPTEHHWRVLVTATDNHEDWGEEVFDQETINVLQLLASATFEGTLYPPPFPFNQLLLTVF